MKKPVIFAGSATSLRDDIKTVRRRFGKMHLNQRLMWLLLVIGAVHYIMLRFQYYVYHGNDWRSGVWESDIDSNIWRWGSDGMMYSDGARRKALYLSDFDLYYFGILPSWVRYIFYVAYAAIALRIGLRVAADKE